MLWVPRGVRPVLLGGRTLSYVNPLQIVAPLIAVLGSSQTHLRLITYGVHVSIIYGFRDVDVN